MVVTGAPGLSGVLPMVVTGAPGLLVVLPMIVTGRAVGAAKRRAARTAFFRNRSG